MDQNLRHFFFKVKKKKVLRKQASKSKNILKTNKQTATLCKFQSNNAHGKICDRLYLTKTFLPLSSVVLFAF